jgi:ATP-dependent RNA helicase DDX42
MPDSDDMDFDPNNPQKKRVIAPLPLLDHSQITYEPFNKNFYKEHPEIANLKEEDVTMIRRDFQIKVVGDQLGFCPKPIISFAHTGFGQQVIEKISKLGFEKPSAIQCQALPIILSGLDLIAVAETGSGKTFAFVWPMLIHVLDQVP